MKVEKTLPYGYSKKEIKETKEKKTIQDMYNCYTGLALQLQRPFPQFLLRFLDL
jgi:hypothetical protein